MKAFLTVTFFMFIFLSGFFGPENSENMYTAWSTVAAVVGIGSALFGTYTAIQAGNAARGAGQMQAQQALDNAQRQAEDAFRKAEEIAYQNLLQITDLQTQSAWIQQESLYKQQAGLLNIEDMLTDFQDQIEFIGYDITELGLTTDYQVSQALAQAEIYSVRAGVSGQAASVLARVGGNISKELGLARALNELQIFDLKQDAKNAIEDVDYQINSSLYEGRVNEFKAKVNSSNAITALSRTVTETDIVRRDNERTIATIKARLIAKGAGTTGSSRDVIRSEQRESRDKVQLRYLSGQIEANSYAIASKLNVYASEMNKREAAYLGNQKKKIAQDTLRTEEIQRASFSITELGYENRLLQNQQAIAEAQAASAIYSMQAGMALETADYLQDLGAGRIAEAQFRQSVLQGESDRQYQLAILDLDYGRQLAEYNLSRITTTVDNLNTASERAREEARWLAGQYLEAGRKGYNVTLASTRSQANSYYAGALSSLSQGLQIFSDWNASRYTNTGTGTTLGGGQATVGTGTQAGTGTVVNPFG